MTKTSYSGFLLYPVALFFIIIALSSCGNWNGFGFEGTSSSSSPYTGTATLHWESPSNRVDGSALSDISGYVIYYGYSPGNYTNWVDVGDVEMYTVTNLPPGTLYFALTAYDSFETESGFSNELTKSIE
jgi:hypothetical protein